MAKPTFTRRLISNKGSLLVTIPAEIATALDLNKGDRLVIYLENDKILMQKALEV